MRQSLASSFVSISSSSSSLSLCVLFLTMMALWSGKDVAARDLRRSRRNTTEPPGRRWGTEAEGTTLISHMCAAQCNAFCNENPSECESVCRSNSPRNWIMNCHEQETEANPAFSDSGDSYVTRSSECPGTCSILKDQEEGGYFIPVTPEVVLVRDVANHSVTLTWSTSDTPSHIVYVVQEKEYWAEAYLVMGADHFTRHNLDVCSRPTYRVAAVSRYGSYWFSNEVTTPDMSPDPPKKLQVDLISHDPLLSSFVITLSWLNPTGWDLTALNPNNSFTWQHYIRCPSSVTFVPEIFEDRHHFTNQSNTLTFHVADFVIGCKIIYAVTTHSKCSADLVSERAYLTMDFSCQSVEDLYSGPYCTAPPINPPGNVKNVRIAVFPGMHGARAHVTWSPPSDLGSAGVVGFYTVFYGFIEDTYGLVTFKDNFYQNITLPGEVTEADVPVAEGNGSGNKFGILVMAGAPSQAIDRPIGYVNQVHATMSDGRVLLDEDIVVYQLEDTREVRVYWSPPSSDLDATGVALQWGPVSKHLVDVIPDASDGVSRRVTYNVTKFGGVDLSVSNTTVLEENQTSFDIQGLAPMETYGIKVLMLYGGERSEDIPEETWRNTRTHVFHVPAAPHASGPTESDGRTSTKPHANDNPASQTSLVVISVAVAAVVVMLAGVALGLWCRRWRRRQKLSHLFRLPQPEFRPYTCFLPADGSEPPTRAGGRQDHDDWELPHSALKVGRVLGTGAFGQVLLGRVSRAVLRHRGLPLMPGAEGGDSSPLLLPVAIKMLKEGCDDAGKQEFLREIGLMKELGHHRHVVSMLGCCTLREPYCLAVQHMAKGDLLNHLKNLRNDIAQSKEEGGPYENHEAEHVSPMDLLSIARQIALGMEFLADKGYVHRDLAARNVLIGEGNEVKVGDFGLARYVYTDRVYFNKKGGKLPLKWMAMESIFDLTFSTASDVWSFGVVLFEIVTLGGTPYPTLHIRHLLKALKEGYRMERPDNCSEEMYSMMRACWRERPEERPTFLSLRQWLEEVMADTSGVHYLDMDLNPDRDYYTHHDSAPDSASSSLSEATPLAVSPLFGKDSNLDSSDGQEERAEEEEEKEAADPSSELPLTTSNGRNSIASTVTSDIIVHMEIDPAVSGGCSPASDTAPDHTSPLSGMKSVRFLESTAEGQNHQTRKVVDSDEVGWSENLSSGSENSAWNSTGSDSPIPSPDVACDEVFTLDLKDKGWFVPSLRHPAPRTGQPRVFPQERHPCSLFRTSGTSDASSSVGDDVILPLMMRKRDDPLDSQGESVYASSSSSGESFSLPLSSSPRSLRPVDSCPFTEQGGRSSSVKVRKNDLLKPVSSLCNHNRSTRQSNVYQQSPSQQRSRKASDVPVKPGQSGNRSFVRGSGSAAALKSADKDIIRPVVFSKSSVVQVTAL